MMRSLFSGVAGLKTHQTKMDVIGNNIANVNTVGFKSSTVTFSDILYQTTQYASGPNSATKTAGVNAKQIGLGSKVNSITTVQSTGGTQTTDSALDCMINGSAYYIVRSGGENLFTKAGSFFVDAGGSLCTASGAVVQGWQVNETETDIERDVVSDLVVMGPKFKTAVPEATTKAYLTGNVDSSDPQLYDEGATSAVSFYDALGNSYTLKLKYTAVPSSDSSTEDGATPAYVPGQYSVSVADCWDKEGNSIFYSVDDDGIKHVNSNVSITFNGITYAAKAGESSTDGEGEVTIGPADSSSETGTIITFSNITGKYSTISRAGEESSTDGAKYDSIVFQVHDTTRDGSTEGGDDTTTASPFGKVELDFSSLTQYAANGKCSIQGQRGDVDGSGEGAGRPVGQMSGLSIDTSGKIYGSYDNGTTRLIGQIAVTTFANATGLEAVGNSYFRKTQNSGEFDGIGKDITEVGGSLTTGALEMSNVDLSSEFTNMITTQRGFQANSRIITTSDTLLEELINLKR